MENISKCHKRQYLWICPYDLNILTFQIFFDLFKLTKSWKFKKIGRFWIKQGLFTQNFAKQSFLGIDTVKTQRCWCEVSKMTLPFYPNVSHLYCNSRTDYWPQIMHGWSSFWLNLCHRASLAWKDLSSDQTLLCKYYLYLCLSFIIHILLIVLGLD